MLSAVSDDQYMLGSYRTTRPQDDCFYKMEQYLAEELKEEKKSAHSKIAIVHSRYASNRRQIDLKHAHPVSDSQSRILVFHNGFITNTSELVQEIAESGEVASELKENLTDSQLIAVMIGAELDKGHNLRQAVKNVIEQKLLGTWRLVVMARNDARCLYASTNSGVLFMGKSADSIILSSS